MACLVRTTFANGPTEKYSVDYGEIAPSALHDTMGVLTISSRPSADVEVPPLGFPEYRQNEEPGEQRRWTSVAATTPLSNFGTVHPGESEPGQPAIAEGFRHPVTAVDGPYVEIAIDPRFDRRLRTRRSDLNAQFRNRIDMLEDLPELCGRDGDLYVNISCFTQSGRRRVYEEPRRDAESGVIDCRNRRRFYGPEHGESLFKVLDREGEFVKIGWFDPHLPPERASETIGWVRSRSNSGELELWIEQVDD